jgi:hypothetical protein
LTLGPSSGAVEGQHVLVIGNPEGLEGTVSDGIISAFRENRSWIQITAPISRGSGGSPVLDGFGQVIGIATILFKDGQNLNFAISSETIRDAIAKSLQDQSKYPVPTPTAVTRATPTPSGRWQDAPVLDQKDKKSAAQPRATAAEPPSSSSEVVRMQIPGKGITLVLPADWQKSETTRRHSAVSEKKSPRCSITGPAKFFRRQIIRRKFVRRDEAELAPAIAPLPESLQQRCIAAPGLLAQVIVSKYCDHQPLYRQEQIYWDRHQVWLPRQSMARWIQLASEWLKPIYREIKEQMMRSSYLQVDETPIRYLDPGNGKTGQGYLWVVHRPGEDVLFEWYTTRETKCLDQLIPSHFNGTIQCDGYSAYERFAKHRAIDGLASYRWRCGRVC